MSEERAGSFLKQAQALCNEGKFVIPRDALTRDPKRYAVALKVMEFLDQLQPRGARGGSYAEQACTLLAAFNVMYFTDHGQEQRPDEWLTFLSEVMDLPSPKNVEELRKWAEGRGRDE